MEPLSRIAIVTNATKVGAVEAASALATIAQAEGVDVRSTAEFPPSLSWHLLASSFFYFSFSTYFFYASDLFHYHFQ